MIRQDTKITVTINTILKDRLKSFCDYKQANASEVVRAALNAFLQEHGDKQ